MKETILIGSDHAGFELKKALVDYLTTEGHKVEDMGAKEFKENDDYPTILAPIALMVAESPDKYRGIVLGGSGQGEAIVSNRFPGVRAALYYGGNLEIVKLSREHNDSNILSLGARFLSTDDAKEAVKLWLSTPFSGDERHVRRNKMLDEIE